MKLENYYLNLDKVAEIESKHDRDTINNYYRDMLHYFLDGREDAGKSIMLTLEKGGYLVDLRDEKLSAILDEK